MYPQGTASSQMVLRGMDLLLECIASGVYVQFAPRLLVTLREAGLGVCACSVLATFWGGRALWQCKKQGEQLLVRTMQIIVISSPLAASLFLDNEERR